MAEVGGQAVKRIGGLWQQIVSFENLLASVRAAASGKRSRPDVARFLMDQELEIVRLQQELESESYTPAHIERSLFTNPNAASSQPRHFETASCITP